MSNADTKELLLQEIKSLKIGCIDACNVIANQPLETQVPLEVASELTLNYIEGLRTDIENSDTPIPTDLNFVTGQFLSEIKEKTEQAEELTAFTKGLIHDLDDEINRLKNLIKIAEESKLKARLHTPKGSIQPQNVEKAKERYRMIKGHMFKLMNSLFPNTSEAMLGVLAELMQQKLNEDSNDYIEVTTENYSIIEMLKDLNIASTNPYNNAEVKLNF